MLISLPTAKGGKTINESGVVDNTQGPFHNKGKIKKCTFFLRNFECVVFLLPEDRHRVYL